MGRPKGSRNKNPKARGFLIDVALTYRNQNKCLIWPFARSKETGYALFDRRFSGTGYAHHFVCKRKHGKRPSKKHVVAHNCGNGKNGCVNHWHIRWATRKENETDKIAHGTANRGERHGMAKLTNKQARWIRRTKRTNREIAIKFDMTVRSIKNIRDKVTYAEV